VIWKETKSVKDRGFCDDVAEGEQKGQRTARVGCSEELDSGSPYTVC